MKRNDVGRSRGTGYVARSAQHGRGYVPMLAAIGDNRDRLLVVSGQDAEYERPSVRLKTDALAQGKLQHRLVSTHLMEKAEALDDPVVQIGQLGLGEFVDVDRHLYLRSATVVRTLPFVCASTRATDANAQRR
jgi:hypothetical protein